jgi:hypothetical protein
MRLRDPLMAAMLCLTILCGIESARAQTGDATYLGKDSMQAVRVVGPDGNVLCNLDSEFDQIPDNPDYFVGRLIQNTDPSKKCSGNYYVLALFRMDWLTSTMAVQRELTPPKFLTPEFGEFISAYDPSIFMHNGEQWIAFMCLKAGFHAPPLCIAPFSIARGIDFSRLSIPLNGTLELSEHSDPDKILTSSVPKPLVFKGKTYIFWSTITIDKAHLRDGFAGGWEGIRTRGAQLEQEAGGKHRLWIAGSGGKSVGGRDEHSVEVWSPDPSDDTRDNVVDLFQVFADGDYVIGIAGVGGTRGGKCVTPLSASEGCYRLEIARTQDPLAPGAFNHSRLEYPRLGWGPVDYPRIFREPGKGLLMISFNTPPMRPAGRTDHFPTGVWRYPVRLEDWRWSK